MFKEGTVEKVSIHMLFSPKLFSTKSLRSGLDTYFHTKFAFSGSRTWKQGKSKNI